MKSAGDTVEDTGEQMADVTDDSEDLKRSTKRLARAFARNFSSMEGDVDGAKDEVQQLDRALNDIDGRDVNAEVNVDTDRAGRVGRGVGEAVGMTGVIEEDMGRDIGEAAGKLSATLGRTTAATAVAGTAIAGVGAAALTAGAALAGAAGLAVKAMQLANELDGAGSAAVQAGMKDLNNAAENLKRQFVKEMSPLLADTVIPALKSMAQEVEKVIPELADFAETWVPSMIDASRGFVDNIPAILRALDFLIRTFAALHDATAAAGYFLGFVLVEAIDGIVRIFQALAKGVINALQYLESFFPESAGTPDWESMKQSVEQMDDALEESSEDMKDLGGAHGEELVENATGSTDTGERDFGVDQDSDLFEAPTRQLPSPAAPASKVQGAGQASLDTGDNSIGNFLPEGKMKGIQNYGKEVDRLKRKLNPLRGMIFQLGKRIKAFGKKAVFAFSEQMGGAIADAIVEGENLLDSFKKIIKGLVKQLIALIAKAVIASALLSVLGIGSTSFASSFKSIIGGGGGLGAATSSAGAATSGASAASAVTQTTGAGATSTTQNMNINITGSTRTEGRDIVTSFETTKQDDRRKGRTDRS